MSYSDIFTAANDATFQGRCLVAMWKAAQDVANESPATDNHEARADWATRVLQDRSNITPRQVAMQVLANAVIASAPASAADADIQYQVNSGLAAIIAIG
jgi:predicted metal-dependent HD superfamily phosphohydrolase